MRAPLHISLMRQIGMLDLLHMYSLVRAMGQVRPLMRTLVLTAGQTVPASWAYCCCAAELKVAKGNTTFTPELPGFGQV